MKTAENWSKEHELCDGSPVALFSISTIKAIQSDARADLEQRVNELEKDKARLDWIQSNATELERCLRWIHDDVEFSHYGEQLRVKNRIESVLKGEK